MKHTRAIEYIIKELKENLPTRLTYHSLQHTLSVMELTRQIGQKEGIGGSELDLLIVAAAYHDCGFLKGPLDHEIVGCMMVDNILPVFGFSPEEIKLVKGMIMATRLPQTPQNHFEEIICDADLGYIGGNKYFEIVKGLEQELKSGGMHLTEDNWLDMQINFLKSQDFFTKYACEKFTANKRIVLSQLESKRNA